MLKPFGYNSPIPGEGISRLTGFTGGIFILLPIFDRTLRICWYEEFAKSFADYIPF